MKNLPDFFKLPRQVGSFAVLPPNTFVKKTGQPKRGEEAHPIDGSFGRNGKGILAAGASWLARLAGYSRLYPWIALVVLLLGTGTAPLSAQPTIEWDKTIGGSNSDHLSDI